MIVAFQPGGSVNDARIVLKYGEKLPRKYNTVRSEVYMESEENPSQWVLIKPLKEVLVDDSPLLGEGELAPVDILDLTEPAEPASFEHVDIIRLGDEDDTTE